VRSFRAFLGELRRPESPMLSTATHLGPLLASAAARGPEIDVNPSFALLQFVVFAALIVVLKPLLFDPVLKVFEAREQRTDGARSEARDMQERAGELLRKYEVELANVNRVAAEERDKLRSETAKLEAEILEQARGAAEKILAEGRGKLGVEVAALRAELRAGNPAVARELASAVLGREVR
jgi:F-type H+-transporting ATPase subunit b